MSPMSSPTPLPLYHFHLERGRTGGLCKYKIFPSSSDFTKTKSLLPPPPPNPFPNESWPCLEMAPPSPLLNFLVRPSSRSFFHPFGSFVFRPPPVPSVGKSSSFLECPRGPPPYPTYQSSFLILSGHTAQTRLPRPPLLIVPPLSYSQLASTLRPFWIGRR